MNPGWWIRALGCVMTVTGASGCGFWLSGRYRQRLKTLEQLRQMMFLLKGQILYVNATLEEAFLAVGERTKGELAELFLRAAKQMESRPGDPFVRIWKEAVEDMGADLPLDRTDRQSLAALGEHLGFLDREMQERNLLLYLEQLDLTMDELRTHREERCRLYSSLGIMGGMFLAILLS